MSRLERCDRLVLYLSVGAVTKLGLGQTAEDHRRVLAVLAHLQS